MEDQGRDGIGFGKGWGAVVIEIIAVDAFDVIYKAMLDLGVEAHHVAEQVCHLGDQSWRGVEDLLGDGDLVFLACVEGGITAEAVGDGGVDGAVGVGDVFDALGEVGHHRAFAGGASVGRGVEPDDCVVSVEVGECGLEVGEQGVELGKSTCPTVDQEDVLRTGAVGVDRVGYSSGMVMEGLGEFLLPRFFSLWDREKVGGQEPTPSQT